jgi:hypothetical protein
MSNYRLRQDRKRLRRRVATHEHQLDELRAIHAYELGRWKSAYASTCRIQKLDPPLPHIHWDIGEIPTRRQNFLTGRIRMYGYSQSIDDQLCAMHGNKERMIQHLQREALRDIATALDRDGLIEWETRRDCGMTIRTATLVAAQLAPASVLR